MRLFFTLTFLLTMSGLSYASQSDTTICITNQSEKPVAIEVRGIKAKQWIGNNRPDKAWNGKSIASKQTLCEKFAIDIPVFSQFKSPIKFSMIFNKYDLSDLLYDTTLLRAGWLTTSNWANDLVLSGGAVGPTDNVNWAGVVSNTAFVYDNHLRSNLCPPGYPQDYRICNHFDIGMIDIRVK